jgi:hypothetical protein
MSEQVGPSCTAIDSRSTGKIEDKAAEKAGKAIKKGHPVVQVTVYDLGRTNHHPSGLNLLRFRL